MLKTVLTVSALFAATVAHAAANSPGHKYDFLDKFDTPPSKPWVSEQDPSAVSGEPTLEAAMGNFYGEFTRDGVVTFYMTHGIDAYDDSRMDGIFNMLQALGTDSGLNLGEWNLDRATSTVTFRNLDTTILYSIKFGNELNEYKDAFSRYEVVMYHGHSRYGRGPAFQDYTNYFRMGHIFSTIEVDTRNPYFQTERMLDTDTYPPIDIQLDGLSYQYQYIGQKTDSSYLPADSYTKIIEGDDKDLEITPFLSGKQLLWFYSCKNINYWRSTLRRKFPDASEKLVFGTRLDGYWSSQPAAVFIMSVVKEQADSQTIVDDLNATGDCGDDCFVSY